MKSLIFTLISLIILIITNPPLEEHHSRVNKIVNSEIQAYKELLNTKNMALFSLVDEFLIRSIAEEMISMQDYYLVSTTILEYRGERQIIGFGILGNVKIFENSEEEIKNLVKQNLFD
jgi:hypothetical protein